MISSKFGFKSEKSNHDWHQLSSLIIELIYSKFRNTSEPSDLSKGVCKGTIHKRCPHIFSDFWPPSPLPLSGAVCIWLTSLSPLSVGTPGQKNILISPISPTPQSPLHLADPWPPSPPSPLVRISFMDGPKHKLWSKKIYTKQVCFPNRYFVIFSCC